jgi:phospholipid/cholesterol/gamma-HCH transport system permease protein
MVVTSQVDALRVFGTDPIRKLVVPRLVAGVLMTPVLTVLADFVGVLGGWLVARSQLHVASTLYWSSVRRTLSLPDIWTGLSKPFVLGFIVVSIGCYQGLTVTGGTQGVGKATNRAVVIASVSIIAADFFLTRLTMSVFY